MIATATSSKVREYIDDVLSGRAIACKATIAAIQRHVDDLDKQGEEGFPYYFDERHALAACEFFPRVIKHSTGDFEGMPFELEPWQAFGVWCMFGWKRDFDDSRRFRRFYWSMGRKNGKSCFAAGLSLFVAMLDINPKTGRPENVGEVILCAPKKEQVEKVIYSEIERMREQSPVIKNGSERINKQIRFHHNSSTIRCVGSDRPYSGLNPSLVVMDETHEWAEFNRKFYDTMLTGSGSRTQPIIGSVTTAGDDQSHIWKGEYQLAKSILSGVEKNEAFFAYIFELDEEDDPLDESKWIKANPNLGVSLKIDYLREQPKQHSVDLNRFIRYHCNRPVESIAKAFDLKEWDAVAGELSNWSEADVICAGFDMGGYDDLCAFALVARFPVDMDGEKQLYRYEARTFAYISATTERDLSKQPFASWIHSGLLKKDEYPQLALQYDLTRQCTKHYVDTIAFDPSNARSTAEYLTQEGFTAATVGQNCSNFNEPIHDLMAAIREHRFRHDGNELLRWCVNNAVLIRDRQDRWMFDKRDSNDKIDPVVAMTMAFRLASVAQGRPIGKLYI